MNPILGIGQTDGAMARIVNQTGAGVVFGWDDKESISAFINLCWNKFNAVDLQTEQNSDAKLCHLPDEEEKKEAIRQFSRKALTKRMAELFDSLTE